MDELLEFSLFLIKGLGGFPYSTTITDLTSKNQRKKWWFVYSCILSVTFCILATAEFVMFSVDFFQEKDQFRAQDTARYILVLSTSITCIVLILYQLLKSPLLYDLVYHIHNFINEDRSPKLYFVVMFVVCLFGTLMEMGYASFETDLSSLPVEISNVIVNVFVYLCYIGPQIVVFYCIVGGVASGYENVFQLLGGEEVSDHPSQVIKAKDLKEARKNLIRLHKGQNTFNNYYSVIVYLLMLKCVVEVIYYIFILSSDIGYNSVVKFGSIAGLIRSIILLLLLCYIPEKVNKKRAKIYTKIRHLRSSLSDDEDDVLNSSINPAEVDSTRNTTSAETSSSNVDFNENLDRLLILMDDYPDFNMGNVFVISKGQIIKIASFVATYVIILLEFSRGDTTNDSDSVASFNCTDLNSTLMELLDQGLDLCNLNYTECL